MCTLARAHTPRSCSPPAQLPRLWLELLAVIGFAVLVVSMVGQGRTLETVLPTLGLFAAAAFRLIPSVNRVISAMQSLRYGLPAIDTLRAEFNLAAPEQLVLVPQLRPSSNTGTEQGYFYLSGCSHGRTQRALASHPPW